MSTLLDSIAMIDQQRRKDCEKHDELLRLAQLARDNTPHDSVQTCWGLSFMCAESGHKCQAAGACIFAPPGAALTPDLVRELWEV